MTSQLNLHAKTRSDPFWNIFAGSFGGLCSLVVGYPLDTVKVRLQTQNCYRGAIDCFKQIIFNEGFASLFRGMSGPALFATPRFALIFYTNAHSRKFVAGEFGNTFETKENRFGHRVNYFEIFLAGGLSQLFVVPCLVAPVERVKVLLQVYPQKQFRGQFHCLSHLVSTEGVRSVWRGTLLTYSRDIPSFSTYFLTYEYLRNEFFLDSSTGYVGLVGILISGAVAGLCGWTVAIPFDVVKNRHQSIYDKERSVKSWSTISTLYRLEGVSGFYRGARPILFRAVPANAVGLLGYEAGISAIASWRNDN